MVYYTRYELIGNYSDDIIAEMKKNENFTFAFGDDIFNSGDDCKWYHHEEEMKELSLKFPKVVFHLYGEGEENNDVWHKYFKNGKMQKSIANISFDEYNEGKLQ